MTSNAMQDGVATFKLWYDEVTNKCYFTFKGKLYPLGIVFPQNREIAFKHWKRILAQYPLDLFIELYFPKHMARDIWGRDLRILVPQMAQEGAFNLAYRYLFAFDFEDAQIRIDGLRILRIPHLFYDDYQIEEYVTKAIGYEGRCLMIKMYDDLDSYEQFKATLMQL